MGDWDESKHPRDKRGEFTESGGGTHQRTGDHTSDAALQAQLDQRNLMAMQGSDGKWSIYQINRKGSQGFDTYTEQRALGRFKTLAAAHRHIFG